MNVKNAYKTTILLPTWQQTINSKLIIEREMSFVQLMLCIFYFYTEDPLMRTFEKRQTLIHAILIN